MNDLLIDEQLRRFAAAVAETSPDPPPVSVRPAPRRPVNPAVAFVSAFALIVVVVGVGAFLVADRADTVAGGTDLVEERWAWLTAGAVALESDLVGVVTRSPMPRFDPATLGEIQRLVPFDEAPYETSGAPSVETQIPPLAYIGTIEGTSTQVVAYRAVSARLREKMLCLGIQTQDGNATGCLPHDAMQEIGIVTGFDSVVPEPIPGAPEPVGHVNFAMLPMETSVVVLRLADGRSFVQQPIGGVAVIEVVGLGESLVGTAQALDADGNVIKYEVLGSADSSSFVDEILADGMVEFVEYERAVFALLACLRDQGLEVWGPTLEPDGFTYSYLYRGLDLSGELLSDSVVEARWASCEGSYIAGVEDTWFLQKYQESIASNLEKIQESKTPPSTDDRND